MKITYYEDLSKCIPILCKQVSIKGWNIVAVKSCGSSPAIVAICQSCGGVKDDSIFFTLINDRDYCSKDETKLRKKIGLYIGLWNILPKCIKKYVFLNKVIPHLLDHCNKELQINNKLSESLEVKIEKKMLREFENGDMGIVKGTFNFRKKRITLSEHILNDFYQCLETFFHEMAHVRQYQESRKYEKLWFHATNLSTIRPSDYPVALWHAEFEYANKKNFDEYYFENIESSAREYSEKKRNRLYGK
ncbi:hypothetical protein Q9R38_25290 [Priestia aryabhattai]|uniref:hypothetical protein n=1 Tax=Priestia aryabhattai TaxID=412384 RepID=UPI002880FD0D|nr:hypothetical protein [Priestia aryabhattai]MDT0149857.1 hypothetical protein [Priestia aryabhattai]MDT0155410.1 hypothetical protein [Priestia aryabhattai]